MDLKSTYKDKESLVNDIIIQQGLPSQLSFNHINKYNSVIFDINFKAKSISVGDMSEVIAKANFIDRYYQSLSHRVEK